MKRHIHQNLEKWHKMSLAEQMGNIGSEVGRAMTWHKKGDNEKKEQSLERALGLIDLTIQDKRLQNRCFELYRLKEVLKDVFLGKNNYRVSLDSLEEYFLSFALIVK